MWIRRSSFDQHTRNDEAQFESIIASLKSHDTNVDVKHAENKRDNQQIKDDIADVKTDVAGVKAQLDDITKLRPAIEAGLLADKDAEYRRKLFKRVLLACIATATTVGGILPLIQFLATVHIHFG